MASTEALEAGREEGGTAAVGEGRRSSWLMGWVERWWMRRWRNGLLSKKLSCELC